MAWSRTGSGNAGSSTGTSLNTGALSVTAGDRVFVLGGADKNETWNAPTDTQGNAYTLINSSTNTNGAKFQLYTAVFAATGTNTITQTTIATGQDGMSWMTFSGLDVSAGSGCVDAFSVGPQGVSATTQGMGTTAATTADNQLAISVYANWGSTSATTSASSGWTQDSGASFPGANADNAWAYKNSPVGTAETGTWTITVAQPSVAGIVVVKLYTPPPPQSEESKNASAMSSMTSAGGI